MEFMTVKEASVLWNIDISTIGKLLRAGKIPEAAKIGGHWVIPKDTPRVLDGRTKAAKAEVKVKEDYFRFPLYVNSTEESFIPALSDEEKTLRQAELDFLACDFKKAEKSLKKLSENAENNYVRIMSLFMLCWLAAGYYNGNGYSYYFMNLEQALEKDFPHKRETELVRPWLYANLTQYEKAADCLDFDMNYKYSPSVYPFMIYLSFIDKISVKNSEAISFRAELYELEVRHLINSGNIFEAQLLHLSLFVFYFSTTNEEKMMFHLKKAAEIAYKYNFIYYIADAYPYYISVFKSVLNNYPAEFANRIEQSGLRLSKSFSAFSKNHNSDGIFYMLSNEDIKFVLYAVGGYSYKQVAGIINVSVRTVANRYAEIYGKLAVNGKQELLEMLKK